MGAIRTIDMFCGAGGSSWGARLAGAEIVAGFDMWPLAEKVYKDNFPEARFFPGRLEGLKPKALVKELGDIDLIMASPECTNHSPAKGNKPRCEKSRETAFQVTRFAKALNPRWIVVENVTSMKKWTRYDEFLQALQDLGYKTSEQTIMASDLGVGTSRRRLFILCDREADPPKVEKPAKARLKTAGEVVDLNGIYPYTPLRKRGRAKATLERAERGMAALGRNESFLLVYYGSDGAGGWQSLDVPLRTITTVDRFALIKPRGGGHCIRMLQPPELKAAMGMPQKFCIKHGTRRDRIHMIGNAVCPPVMRTAVKALSSND